jgi:hypothetical protein
MDRIVACHQPNFLPWLGFYAKLARADVFILLDDVQFTRGHNKHNWTTRVKILGPNEPFWISLPVKRSGEGLQKICDLSTLRDDLRWLPKLIRSLENSYKKKPYFQEVAPHLLEIISGHTSSICETNVALICQIASMLRLKTNIIKSSELEVNASSNQRLVDLTRAVDGTTYLAGDGAEDYQIIDMFKGAGLNFNKLGFKHPEYDQLEGLAFFPGLSIFDVLCCVGIEQTRELLVQ